MFEVLKITFRMKTPVLLGHPWIFSDALIVHTLMRRVLGDEYYNLPSNYPLHELVDKLDVPIRRIVYDDNKFIYDASVSIIDGKFYPYRNVAVTHVRKRFCEKYVHEVKTRRDKVDIARGAFRLYNIKFIYVPCREVTFYVNAVESEVVELLRYIRAIGKKRAEGFGFIKDFSYEKVELKTAIQLNDYTVTRPVPAQLIDINETVRRFGTCELVPQSTRPPYWSPKTIEPATIPGKKYILKVL